MKNVYILCEGQTEESFINEVIYPYFLNIGIYIRPIICTTKRTIAKKHKGGVSDYNKIKTELKILCKQHKNEIVTTMFDYYAMPDNTPEIHHKDSDIYKQIEYIENKITEDINHYNCFFGLMLHEFEGLLFSSPQSFELITDINTTNIIQDIRDSFDSPEHINNSVETAPSKRLEKLIPNYSKIRNGTIISKEIGIDRLMEECKHFSDWIEKIKTFELQSR
ncbi:DUF4276 family protein [Sedimentibacter sp.]|uniref:DUF4276 family protein n=1 Tax=Sedimentibacter sp. TaxID=1960295 RepID=UPI0028AE9744|nr:DUF4276 family protein [Sedimentibacter sp.]